MNNKVKSSVNDLKWTCDGTKVCIVYNNGIVMTGSVEGARIWSKNFDKKLFYQVEWSMDSKLLYLCTVKECYIYDDLGNFVVR